MIEILVIEAALFGKCQVKNIREIKYGLKILESTASYIDHLLGPA